MIRQLRIHASSAMVAMVLLGTGVAMYAGQTGPGSIAPIAPYVLKTGPAPYPAAGWKDLETWTRDVGMAPDREVGIGFHLSGSGGMVSTSFAVTRLRNSPNAVPTEVAVMLIPASDPSRVRWSNLTFSGSGRDKKPVSVDASSRVVTYPPAPYGPGDSPIRGHATLTAKEFARIADALDLRVTALSMALTYHPDQLKALREFAQRVGLLPPRR